MSTMCLAQAAEMTSLRGGDQRRLKSAPKLNERIPQSVCTYYNFFIIFRRYVRMYEVTLFQVVRAIISQKVLYYSLCEKMFRITPHQIPRNPREVHPLSRRTPCKLQRMLSL